jgi:tetratricopeptide (TPR) repeat protein
MHGKLAAAGLAVFFLGNAIVAQVQQETVAPKVGVSLPDRPWTLVFEVPGFKVKTNGLQPDGRAYLLAENQTTQVVLSVFLEKTPDAAKAADCEGNQKKRLEQKVNYKREKIETREVEGMVVVEFTIPEFSGAPIQQRNLFACLRKDDVYVDIHLSKVQFKPQQEELFTAVLNSAHFVTKAPTVATSNPNAPGPAASATPASTTLQYFLEGGRYFLQRNYPASIGPYQRALDLEKQSRTLTKDYWRALVDNLGMAYGITGELDRAEEILNYGLSQDPTYPNFYYNLACVAAERNDMEKTMDFLRKAFSYKGNVIAGESMPDPRQDDSFRPFMGDNRFRQFLDSL